MVHWFIPAQVQVHGPAPATAEGVPALQRFATGCTPVVHPFAHQHTPFTLRFAVQFAVAHPFHPAQPHAQPFAVVVMAEGVPALQRFVGGL